MLLSKICLHCWIVPLLLDHTDIASVLHKHNARSSL